MAMLVQQPQRRSGDERDWRVVPHPTMSNNWVGDWVGNRQPPPYGKVREFASPIKLSRRPTDSDKTAYTPFDAWHTPPRDRHMYSKKKRFPKLLSPYLEDLTKSLDPHKKRAKQRGKSPGPGFKQKKSTSTMVVPHSKHLTMVVPHKQVDQQQVLRCLLPSYTEATHQSSHRHANPYAGTSSSYQHVPRRVRSLSPQQHYGGSRSRCYPESIYATPIRGGQRVQQCWASPEESEEEEEVGHKEVDEYLSDREIWARLCAAASRIGMDPESYAFLLDMQHRDITPEDYDLLQQLDKSVLPKTLGQERVHSFPTGQVGEDGKVVDTEGSPAAFNVSDSRCAVCLEEFKPGERVRMLPCKHTFHKDCIDLWLTKSSLNCPVDGLPVHDADKDHDH